MQGDTLKIKTKSGYFSCLFGKSNAIIVLHPTPSDFDKIKDVNFMGVYRQLHEKDFLEIDTRIVLIERNR